MNSTYLSNYSHYLPSINPYSDDSYQHQVSLISSSSDSSSFELEESVQSVPFDLLGYKEEFVKDVLFESLIDFGIGKFVEKVSTEDLNEEDMRLLMDFMGKKKIEKEKDYWRLVFFFFLCFFFWM